MVLLKVVGVLVLIALSYGAGILTSLNNYKRFKADADKAKADLASAQVELAALKVAAGAVKSSS